MSKLRSSTILDGNALFEEFKGALTEQFVMQQLQYIDSFDTYYWSNDRGNAEIDFLIDDGENITPIEVKAEINLKAKSLKLYKDMFNPKYCIRTSMADYKVEDWLINLPLYAVTQLSLLLHP